MTTLDSTKIMAILRAAYPRFYINQSREDIESAVNLWTMMFSEDDPSLVMDAVRAFIKTDTKGFPPSIGQISEKLRNIQCACFGNRKTAIEAWGEVSQKLKKGAYRSKEAFDELPEISRRIIGSPSVLHDWATCEDSVTQSVISSNFQREYNAAMEKEREIRSYPEDIRRGIEKTRREALGEPEKTALPSAEVPLYLRDADEELDKIVAAMSPAQKKEFYKRRCAACMVNFDEEEEP